MVLASLTALAGGLALYAREELINPAAFTDRTLDAVHQAPVQRVLAREIAVQVVEPSVPDAIAARPVIESAVRLVVASDNFAPVIRLAATHGNRLLFERGGNAVFDIADAGTVVSSALRTLAPRIASEIPRHTDVIIATLRKRSFATETLRFADTVRVLGLVLPPVAIALFVLAVAVAPDRRRAITRSGIAVGVTGIVTAVAFELIRRYVKAHVYGTDELSNSEVRAAVGDLWGAYLNDFLTWTLLITALAWLVAAASASLLAPYSSVAGMRRVLALARRPQSDWGRGVAGAIALVFGLVVILEPGTVLSVIAVIGGCLLVYVGAGELLSVTVQPRPEQRRLGLPRPREAIAFGGMAAAVVAGIVVAFALTGGSSRARASSIPTCNGYRQLCDRRLDELVFAGTHNSMSAANTPGWLIANQDRPVAQQLQDGIRLFKISTHYGLSGSGRFVRTDISSEGTSLNRVASKLTPAARQALQRLSHSLSGDAPSGTRDVWLCHTLCELGATRFVSFMSTIRRFLEVNPDQVIILFDEDYVSESDLQSALKRAGVFRRLATLRQGDPLPTLGALIRSHKNIVVFAQKPVSGRYPWNTNGFAWIQDTPLGAVKPSQFTCKLSRGYQSNPLLMMNNWADVFPPRPSPNLPLVKRGFILNRAQQCIAERGHTPNLILTDYYGRGDVVGAAAELNGVAGQRPAETTSVG